MFLIVASNADPYEYGLTMLPKYLGFCMDASMCSLSEEAASSEDVLCVPEYAEDIHRYLRECEVGIFTFIGGRLHKLFSLVLKVNLLNFFKTGHNFKVGYIRWQISLISIGKAWLTHC